MILISPRKVPNNGPIPSEIYLHGTNIKLSGTAQPRCHSWPVSSISTRYFRRLPYLPSWASQNQHNPSPPLWRCHRNSNLRVRAVWVRLLQRSSFWLPKHLLDRLQKVQNNAARRMYRSSKFNHVTPLLHTLHWLPTEKRIDFKLASLFFQSLNGSAPMYLSDILHFYTPSRPLRSSADTRVFRIPSFRTQSKHTKGKKKNNTFLHSF